MQSFMHAGHDRLKTADHAHMLVCGCVGDMLSWACHACAAASHFSVVIGRWWCMHPSSYCSLHCLRLYFLSNFFVTSCPWRAAVSKVVLYVLSWKAAVLWAVCLQRAHHTWTRRVASHWSSQCFAAHDISLTDMTLYHFKILHSHNDSEAHQSCTSNTAASQQTVHWYKLTCNLFVSTG